VSMTGVAGAPAAGRARALRDPGSALLPSSCGYGPSPAGRRGCCVRLRPRLSPRSRSLSGPEEDFAVTITGTRTARTAPCKPGARAHCVGAGLAFLVLYEVATGCMSVKSPVSKDGTWTASAPWRAVLLLTSWLARLFDRRAWSASGGQSLVQRSSDVTVHGKCPARETTA